MNRFLMAMAVFATTVFLLLQVQAGATKFKGIQAVDKETLLVRFQDGDIRYRDDGTGKSAYLGHSFAAGDDTLLTFLPRLNPDAAGWAVGSSDDTSFGNVGITVSRKSKPMYVDHTLRAELEHWIFLRLSRPMKQGCTYTVRIPAGTGSDTAEASIRYDIWSTFSEAIHVNILGYLPQEEHKSADLYYWLGDGGARD